MIGQKIKRLRLELGLSQKQLAGKEMTRAFISQVENGHCTPSAQTLQILAGRLGKPIAYFLEESGADDNGARLLWDSALADTAQQQWGPALVKITEALRLVRRGEDSDSEVQLQYLSARCLYHLRRFDEALDAFEEVEDRFRSMGKTLNAIGTSLEIGHCYMHLQQFSAAKRVYRKVVRYSAGIKSAQEHLTTALCYLASTQSLMGEPEEAIKTYHEALGEADPHFTPALWARIAMGLGAAYRRLGKLDHAKEWNRRALSSMKEHRSEEALLAQHNLALVAMDLGQWEEAYALLQRTLTGHQEHNDLMMQASVMEDIAKYWLHKGNSDQAERVCWQALDRLTGVDNARLRGLIYRQLSRTYAMRGQVERARELLALSIEFLRRAQAVGLLTTLEAEMATLRENPDQDGQTLRA